MKVLIWFFSLTLIVIMTLGCSKGDDWHCVTRAKSMFSQSTSGKIAGAKKACSCAEIKAFEIREFGYVDEQGMKDDFGC